jgi:hypothetical protein
MKTRQIRSRVRGPREASTQARMWAKLKARHVCMEIEVRQEPVAHNLISRGFRICLSPFNELASAWFYEPMTFRLLEREVDKLLAGLEDHKAEFAKRMVEEWADYGREPA